MKRKLSREVDMFYSYGATGLTFSGTLENLLGTRRVEEIRGVHPAAASGAERHDSGADLPPGSGQREAAKEAYRHAIDWHNRPDPIHHADQIMTAPVLTVSQAMPAEQAWKLMLGRRIHHLPILSEQGLLIGIVSGNDFLRSRGPDGHLIPSLVPEAPISSLMTTPVITADALTDIRRIAHVLIDRRIGAMPIFREGGELAGIITRSDILRALINNPPMNIWG